MTPIIQKPKQPLIQPIERQESKAVLVAKFIVVAAVIAGLITATYFTGGALVGLIAAGAAFWKIGLLSAACTTLLISTVGGVYFSLQDNMFMDTEHNLRDCTKFVLHTLFAQFILTNKLLESLQNNRISKLILND